MGSFVGALVGGLLIGLTWSRWAGCTWVRTLAASACLAIFIAVLLFRPTRPVRAAGVMTRPGALAVAVLAALPLLVHSDFWLHFAIMTLFFALLGQAWNLLGGYGGQRSFGHAAFFGTGAYAAAILQVDYGVSPWACLVLAGVFGGAAGALVGALSFRYGLRGSYFALITLAFAEVRSASSRTA